MIELLNFQTIGWRAAYLRQRAGLVQTEAARKAGISLRTWRHLELGRRCQDRTIFAIASAFGCPIGWLIDVDGACRRIKARRCH
jgi:transcriptional regulator with XRE-family HTH domain